MYVTDQSILDPLLYRNGMARYAGHVQVVTTVLGDELRGVTITAACSVSDAPPTVLVCLNNSNPNNAIFERAGMFALNALGDQHRALAGAFAGLNELTTADRFSLGRWHTLVTGAPVLDDAVVSFDCELVEVKQMSTHAILFGSVKGVHFGPEAPSLMYRDRGFRGF
ncbi:flavin reductase [Neorhizobium lilium]|uniref:Flavin reductase n=1 Tax=Neorhizobium lilium TaxID=2503024 RepID=A0A3S3TUY4_9HYPH|nr:flavin reductase [Neorhizobium lilium]RWX75467.1 flavin reductase [Neorhizobium lilium]